MASAAEGDVGAVAELATVLRWGFQDLSLNKLATSLGASEQALRLIISIFLEARGGADRSESREDEAGGSAGLSGQPSAPPPCTSDEPVLPVCVPALASQLAHPACYQPQSCPSLLSLTPPRPEQLLRARILLPPTLLPQPPTSDAHQNFFGEYACYLKDLE
ncbi:uncharacterized protein [Physeter macrocephalus]|uniref:Uncharacterized protein isoform X1 n=1 Tax=Physeter macrocephalus TaxID=9755 RepID=A0A9W2WQK1_PHYMC|nr:uncharacterized protein LOC114486467 isoform X1 [Physeter catodon]